MQGTQAHGYSGADVAAQIAALVREDIEGDARSGIDDEQGAVGAQGTSAQHSCEAVGTEGFRGGVAYGDALRRPKG